MWLAARYFNQCPKIFPELGLVFSGQRRARDGWWDIFYFEWTWEIPFYNSDSFFLRRSSLDKNRVELQLLLPPGVRLKDSHLDDDHSWSTKKNWQILNKFGPNIFGVWIIKTTIASGHNHKKTQSYIHDK